MRIRYLCAFFLVLLSIVLSSSKLRAQSPAEEPVIKQANTYFINGDFPAAMPLYSQLLSNHKEDANYNYRYGVCVLFASAEKEKGLKFLENASKSPDVEADVWFYLGKAYHLNYQFEQAITSYNKYKTLAGPKKAEKMQVDNQIAMCKTGRKLLKAITDITVLDKAELNEADFFRRYDLRGAGYSGQLLVKPDEFKTALDKKKNEQSIIFLSGEKTELYFASYGEDESQGKDIYVVRKLPNGTWGKPQNVGYPINTEYDEDFPFLHPNGKVLYFSSKGHSSMGGYDIFRAEKNEDVGTWLKPVNLDFAINSPDDDIMFISDLDEKTAWFASNRSSPEGKMTVYHVVIERKPVNMCLIAGTFTPTPGDPNRSAKITVKNAETNEPLGVYKSNETTGKYLINLPNNGGKYTFTVDHSGIATQTEFVFVPPQYQIKTLNQQCGYNEVNNESKLFITTDFDADTSMLDPTFLKDKAKLDLYNETPTGTEIVDLGQLPGTLPEAGGVDSGDGNDTGDDSVDTSSEVPGTPPTKVQNEELVKSANEDAASTQQEAIDLNVQKEKAWTNATQINQQAKAKTAEAKAAKEKADAMPEGPEKIAAQKEADKLAAEANALQSQAAAAISIAQALDNDAKQKQLEADKAKQYAASLDKAVKNNDSKALDAAVKQGSELQAMSDARPESGQTAKNLQGEADKKHAELDKAKTAAQDLREEIAQNEERKKQLRDEQAKEKDPDLRAQIDSQIEGIDEDIADIKKDLDAADKKVTVLQNQANDLDNQAKGANDAIAQSKSPSVTGSVISADDKKALAADAIAYQQSISESGTSRAFAPVTLGSEPTGTQTAGTQPTGTQTVGSQQSTVGSQSTGSEPTGTQTTGSQQSAVGSQSTGSEPTGTQPVGSQQSAVGSQTTGSEPTGTQTAGTQTTGTEPGDDSDNVVVNETVDPSIAFNESIQKTDTITDPVAREKAKAAVYSEWAASIDDQIKEKRQELAGTTDKTKKAQLNADIKALQAEKSQKEKDAKASLAAADKEQKAQIASGTTQPAVSSEQFISQLNNADANPSVAEKENAKSQIYSDWADSLDAAATAKENGLPKIKDKKQQEKVKQEVAALRAEAETKRGLADDAKSKAAAAETSTQPVASTTPGDVKYDDPTAAAALKEQDNLMAQAEQNKANRDSLTNLAASASGDQKNKLLTAASDQQREAWNNEAAASAKLGEADRKQFEKNDQRLKPLDAAAVSSTDPNASVAALLSAEARALFEKAEQERDSANATTNNFIKREALQRAEENERKGLQKQQEALALYQKSGVEPIASGTQPTGTQTAGAQTVGSQQSAVGSQQSAVGSQSTGSQPTGTQPVGSQQSAVGSQSAGSEPTGTQTTGTQTAGTQPVGSQQSAVGSQSTGSEPTGTQTTGTQPVGSQQSAVGSQSTGSEPTGTQTAGTQSVGSQQSAVGSQSTGSKPTGTQTAGTQPVGSQQSAVGTQSSGSEPTGTQTAGTQSVGSQQSAVGSQSAGSEPTGTQTTGTQPVGSQSTGSEPTGTQTSGSEPTASRTQIIDPSTGQPLSSIQVNEIRGSEAYRNYAAATKEAVQSDNEAAGYRQQADGFQSSADSNIVKAQDFAVKAADEKNKTKKQEYLDESKRYNALAAQDMASRDSVNELADAASTNANANRNNSKNILKGLDPKTADQVKAVATAEQSGNPLVARTGAEPTGSQSTGSEPTGTQTVGSQQSAVGSQSTGSEPTGTQSVGSQQSAVGSQSSGSEPTGTQTAGTQPTGTQSVGSQQSAVGSQSAGSEPTGTQTAGTQPTGTQSVGSQQSAVGSQSTGSEPTGTQTTGTQSVGSQQSAVGSQSAGSEPTGTRNPQPGTQNSVTTRLAPGEELKLAPPTAAATAPTIAVNPSLPEGLVYKVQIGAFRNPISAEIYKGISPVTAETTASGLTRYTAGIFKQFANADAAKAEIRALGYKDAFVVAFYNGKRISIDEARRMTGESPIASTGTQSTGTQTTGAEPTGTQPTGNQNPERGTPNTSTVTSSPNAAKAVDVKELKGLFYTVQVGVYKNEVSKAKLKNLPDLVNERVNGFIRYSSGKYCTPEDASAAKNNAVSKGITDAFVTAYYNGKRISVSEAKALEATGVVPCQGGTTPTPVSSSQSGQQSATGSQSSSQPSSSQSSQQSAVGSQSSSESTSSQSGQQSSVSSQQSSGSEPSSTATEPASTQNPERGTPNTSTLTTKPPVPATGLVFSVQIGAFRDEVPVEIANQFIKLSSKGVKNYLDASTGLTVYQVGVCMTKEEAETFRSEAVAVGITDAFIVAFKDGQKITMEEAMELLGQ